MSEAKIEIKIGQIEFSGQGSQEWVAKQLDKILAKAEELVAIVPPAAQPPTDPHHQQMQGDASIASKTLPAFLTDQGASKSQVKKFLATAIWLQGKGNRRVTTSQVTKALKDSNQSRLGNAADCLNKNVSGELKVSDTFLAD